MRRGEASGTESGTGLTSFEKENVHATKVEVIA